LRVELSWEHPIPDQGQGTDLDLHVHAPMSTAPFVFRGQAEDCGYANCVVGDFAQANSPRWFADPPARPPQPVNWWLDPDLTKNTCFFDPEGVGEVWREGGQGCHNPRLDLDNLGCNSSLTDPTQYGFCGPENINVDYPPSRAWMRIMVHYYSHKVANYAVHPNVKVFCNGALAAELGQSGFYDGSTPVTFLPSDADSDLGTGNLVWEVADVSFPSDPCFATQCVVAPIYSDPAAKTPLLTTETALGQSFFPAYPPLP
jgi:hypothetical protein